MSREMSAVLFIALAAASLRAAEVPAVKDLRTQKVGDLTYFRVEFVSPADFILPRFHLADLWRMDTASLRDIASLPRLVPQGEGKAEFFFYIPVPLDRAVKLEFLGRCKGDPPANFLLIYPVKINQGLPKNELFADGPVGLNQTDEAKVSLDFTKAVAVPKPADGQAELERSWATAKVRHFGVQQLVAPEFLYFSVTRERTARQFEVRDDAWLIPPAWVYEKNQSQLYDQFAGPLAVTEMLARHRLSADRPESSGERSVRVGRLRGFDAAANPWDKMRGDKRPVEEPLAALIPHDNYYLTSPNLSRLVAFGDLLEQWGGGILHAVEVRGRDYHVRERYEKQLCLPAAQLARQVDAKLLRDAALTGSDVAFVEGTDVSVLFHVTDRVAFLQAVEPFLDAARKEHGKALREAKGTYRDTPIESFTTERREVSLHRAAVGDFVIYANSRPALERILDVKAGNVKALADAPDFRYMRTVFIRDGKKEDGFAFLSDAFLCRLFGPVTKIKEKRRLEALTSLQLATHAALSVAAETGALPVSTKKLLVASGLRPEDLEVPEGSPVEWDAGRKQASSSAYNTMHFMTPLVELPVELVTPQEEADYTKFRQNYQRMWRPFINPMGFRLALVDHHL